MIDSAPTRDFSSLGLPQSLVAVTRELGFERPTEIQVAAIPALLAGSDVTGVARTGTGKTAAFGLPLLAALDPELRATQALVLTPTRELAIQVSDSLTTFARGCPGVEVVAVYGGSPFVPQKRALDRGAHVVVGTPGRIMDHLDRGTLTLGDIRFAVLDEADEMLRMGFAEDVDRILKDMPRERQTALFSATMPPAIRRVADRHLTDPVDVTIAGETTTAASVQQSYAVVPFPQRAEALARTLETSDADATIVFVRTRAACDQVSTALARHGIRSAVLNGDVPQTERERIVSRLRDGGVDVLVATDVAARGLDVERVDLVVNFDAPQDTETYVHRVGRTGRAERTGKALTFFGPRERHMIRQIERATGATLEQVAPPEPTHVYAHRTARTLAGLASRASLPRMEDYRAALAAHAEESGVDVADLAAALLAHAAGDDGSWTPPPPREARPPREHARPRTSDGDSRREQPRPGRPRRDRERGARGTDYRIAVGHRQGARPANIVAALTASGRLDGSAIGRIDIRDNHSIVEFMEELPEAARRRMAMARIAGRPTHLERQRGAERGKNGFARPRHAHAEN